MLCIADKSARFKCGSVIEIETPLNGKDVQSDEAESDDKPSWYPGPDQVPGWGYVRSAGYPQYYRGGQEASECRWTVRASRKRRVRLTIVDLSIRSKFTVSNFNLTHLNMISFFRCPERREGVQGRGDGHGERPHAPQQVRRRRRAARHRVIRRRAEPDALSSFAGEGSVQEGRVRLLHG